MAKPAGGLQGLDQLMAMAPPKGMGPNTKPGDPGDPKDPSADPTEENAFDDEQKPDDMLVGAAHDVMSAMRARDPEQFAASMKSFVSMC